VRPGLRSARTRPTGTGRTARPGAVAVCAWLALPLLAADRWQLAGGRKPGRGSSGCRVTPLCSSSGGNARAISAPRPSTAVGPLRGPGRLRVVSGRVLPGTEQPVGYRVGSRPAGSLEHADVPAPMRPWAGALGFGQPADDREVPQGDHALRISGVRRPRPARLLRRRGPAERGLLTPFDAAQRLAQEYESCSRTTAPLRAGPSGIGGRRRRWTS